MKQFSFDYRNIACLGMTYISEIYFEYLTKRIKHIAIRRARKSNNLTDMYLCMSCVSLNAGL